MKSLWVPILSLIVASDVFASNKNVELDRSLGKPGVNAFFTDMNTIEILPNVEKEIVIGIQISGEEIHYNLQPSEGLTVRDLEQASIVVNESQSVRILSIPVTVLSNGEGRYYLHVNLSVIENGLEKKSVISKIISSQTERQAGLTFEKSKSQSIHVLPATETVIQK